MTSGVAGQPCLAAVLIFLVHRCAVFVNVEDIIEQLVNTWRQEVGGYRSC
jgi:hypothetical protein